MKIEYDKEADALYLGLREAAVARSEEIEEGVVVDFDEENHIVGLEVLDVSRRLRPQELVNVSIENLPVG
jgi:uncharacterized protein YuzE